MKKILFSLVAIMLLGSTVPMEAQRHRHTPRTTVVDDTKDDNGIEAYSDTSSTAQPLDSTAYSTSDDADDINDSNRFDPSRFSDPFSWFAFLGTSGFVGILLTILLLGVGLLFLFMPLIIVLLIMRYMVRRHNDRVRLAEKAMEQGQPISEGEMPLNKKSPDYLWRRGVRNVSIGAGLALFFWFLGADPLVGIGLLVACLGLGQMFMVRYNYNSKFGRKKEEPNDDFDNIDSDITDIDFGDKDKK
ncbi:DUF6249 domain-containing protein [uncultured Prevotella sp.]|uniref:DUF6249 domain-containing protein n=1 Tax=uncultured Prevotella sp. TaxID=159272 RepID=UPI002604921D|nr:DUF6249 domain-containing protein [uncultured Prevotella sp.]